MNNLVSVLAFMLMKSIFVLLFTAILTLPLSAEVYHFLSASSAYLYTMETFRFFLPISLFPTIGCYSQLLIEIG